MTIVENAVNVVFADVIPITEWHKLGKEKKLVYLKQQQDAIFFDLQTEKITQETARNKRACIEFLRGFLTKETQTLNRFALDKKVRSALYDLEAVKVFLSNEDNDNAYSMLQNAIASINAIESELLSHTSEHVQNLYNEGKIIDE